MATTISYTKKAGNAFFTIDELNTLFTQIEIVLAQKMDRRGFTLAADLQFYDKGGIINMPPVDTTTPGILEVSPRGAR